MCIDSVPKPLSLEDLNKKYDALALETQGRLYNTTTLYPKSAKRIPQIQ